MGNPHVLVVPYPTQGHVVPLMELSQCLVKNGIKITFMNTEDNHKWVMNALPVKDDKENQIHLVSVPLELNPDGRSQLEKIVEAFFLSVPRKLVELIEKINASDSEKITCVLADHMLGWVMQIAAEKGIRGVVFCAEAATRFALRSCIPKLIDDGIIDNDGTPAKKQLFQLSPNMPVMSTSHFGWVQDDNEAQKMIFENMARDNRSMNLSDWVLCNSTYDLEPAAFEMYPKILPIGPVFAHNLLGDCAENILPEDKTCLKWLDQHPPQSVIYVAFGSIAIFDQTQFQELAMGLELSNRPFLWVVRSDIIDIINGSFLKRFQEKDTTRSHIVNRAPQRKILEHPSIACFISHCGWNSTLEGVNYGIPFLCLPYFADQFHNENYICNVWKVGLGFTRNERGVISHEEIKSKVDQLLDNEEYKANALSLKEQVMNSIKKGGRSYKNLKNFTEWINT